MPIISIVLEEIPNIFHEIGPNHTMSRHSMAILFYLAEDNYLRVHNLSSVTKEGDWIRLFSPIEVIDEIKCLSFNYFSRYMNVKAYLYNETSQLLLMEITYDGQQR